MAAACYSHCDTSEKYGQETGNKVRDNDKSVCYDETEDGSCQVQKGFTEFSSDNELRSRKTSECRTCDTAESSASLRLIIRMLMKDLEVAKAEVCELKTEIQVLKQENDILIGKLQPNYPQDLRGTPRNRKEDENWSTVKTNRRQRVHGSRKRENQEKQTNEIATSNKFLPLDQQASNSVNEDIEFHTTKSEASGCTDASSLGMPEDLHEREVSDCIDASNVLEERFYEKEKAIIIGDSMVRHVSEHITADVRVYCHPGSRIEHLEKILENNMDDPDIVILHSGTNNIHTESSPTEIMEKMNNIVSVAQRLFPRSTVCLSGVLRRRDEDIRYIDSVNSVLDWICKNKNCIFVDGNSWIGDKDIGRDGLHLNRKGSGKFGRLLNRVITHLDSKNQC